MKMELLSPAGDRDALIAAVRAGADAVYLGGQALSARKNAANFDADGLRFAADYCHERGRKVHITVNTLLKDVEFGQLEALAKQMARAGVDAAIVQDWGVAAALRHMLPGLPLHASTQMAVHNPQGVAVARRMGFSRVVLAREMHMEEIEACAREGVQIEVFVHGALCVSCSGQCLLSSMIGGRSGNRGLCAQPCRLDYALVGPHGEAARGNLLSPRDLMRLAQLPALERAGVASLKIEGRLKRAEYVSIVTGVYRRALDELEARGDVTAGEYAVGRLRAAFNRDGFTAGYGPETPDADIMCAPKSSFAPRSDEEALRAEREALARPEKSGIALIGDVQLRVGRRAYLRLSDGKHTAASSGETVEAAQGRPIGRERALAQLEKTGGTPYHISDWRAQIDDNAFISAAALNALRRQTLESLGQIRAEEGRVCPTQINPLEPLAPRAQRALPAPARLCAQSNSFLILQRSLFLGADEACFAPADITPEGLERAIEDARQTCFSLALGPVARGEDLQNLNRWARQNAGRIRRTYLGNIGQLAYEWPGENVADFTMNLTNTRALETLGEWGVRAFTPSVELTAREIDALEGDKHLIVYGRIPLMQLRHCPLSARAAACAHSRCNRCDQLPEQERLDGYALIDRRGKSFALRRLKTGTGCVVRLLNSVPLMPLKHAAALPDARVWRMLLEFEDLARLDPLISVYRAAARGEDFTHNTGWAALERMDATNGHYFRGVE